MDPQLEYRFPVIRGVQAQREYYVTMCPARLLPRIFYFDEEELAPELRAQRVLNRARLPEMARYMIENPGGYVFSAITASIDADVQFEPIHGDGAESQRMGVLRVPMDAKFIINDGQHRRAAIEQALRERPDLGDENIAVVFFLDIGLARCQQMFADLNRHAVKPSRSLGVLYDTRDKLATVAKRVALQSDAFKGVVELERSTLSARSRKLFTLSAIYSATSALAAGHEDQSGEELFTTSDAFWCEVARQFAEWRAVREGSMSAGEVRRDYIHSHGIVLHSLGHVAHDLLWNGAPWKRRLQRLRGIDWSRSNATAWEGRAMIGGRVSKAANHVVLTTNLVKRHLELALSEEEQRVEELFLRGGAHVGNA